MKVGFLINLSKDAYGCIEHAASLGFNCGQLVNWDMSLYNNDIAAEIKRACTDFDFTISALWCGWSGPVDWSYPNMYETLGLVPAAWREQRCKDILNGAEFARAIGVKDIITHIGYIPDNPRHPDNIGVAMAVRCICRSIAPYGQRLLFETGEELPTSIIMLMADAGVTNVGINFDPSNLIFNGRANPVDALERLMPYVYGFHGKDAIPAVGVNPKGKQVEVGEGRANFPVLIKMLKDAGRELDITIEHEMEGVTDRDTRIINAKKYLEKIIEEIYNG